MSVLPRVTELTRERISREFDDLGPDACMAEIKADLRQHNPELLDMASRWAAGGEASALTFNPHPVAVLRPDRAPPAILTPCSSPPWASPP